MIEERVNSWRELASKEPSQRQRKVNRGSAGLSFKTTSQHYFELLTSINQLRAALIEACDVIEAQDRLKATRLIDDFEELVKRVKNERPS